MELQLSKVIVYKKYYKVNGGFVCSNIELVTILTLVVINCR